MCSISATRPPSTARVDGYVEGGTTVTFSYWNGSSWADLPTTRNTFAQNQGSGTAEWQMPQGWVTSTVGEKTAYWIRVDGTASSATPLRISRTTGIRNFKSPTAGPGGGTYVPFAWEDHDVSAIVANAWGPGDVLIGTESHPGGERFRLQCWLGGRLVPTETVDDVTTTYKWYYWASIDCQRPTVHLGLTLIWGPHDGQWIKDGSEETEGCWSHESVLCSYLSMRAGARA